MSVSQIDLGSGVIGALDDPFPAELVTAFHCRSLCHSLIFDDPRFRVTIGVGVIGIRWRDGEMRG